MSVPSSLKKAGQLGSRGLEGAIPDLPTRVRLEPNHGTGNRPKPKSGQKIWQERYLNVDARDTVGTSKRVPGITALYRERIRKIRVDNWTCWKT